MLVLALPSRYNWAIYGEVGIARRKLFQKQKDLQMWGIVPGYPGVPLWPRKEAETSFGGREAVALSAPGSEHTGASSPVTQ